MTVSNQEESGRILKHVHFSVKNQLFAAKLSKMDKFVLFDPLIDLISAILARKQRWRKKQRGVSELEKRDL